MPTTTLDREQILQMAGGFRFLAVLGAAAELNLFTRLGNEALSAETIAIRLPSNLRATAMLLDALVALGLLAKQGEDYSVPAELRPWLSDNSPDTILPMILHQMSLIRMWSQLAWIVRSGEPGVRQASIRGAEADRAAFIAAMHSVSGPVADGLVARLGPPKFRHLLDVGGASGTWALAFLRAVPEARATIFDLPDAIEQARDRIAQSGFGDRVELVSGDFYDDPLPGGVDLAWVSAIVHQHAREDNRELFAKVRECLVPGGRIMIRDMVMEPDRTAPLDGALFAVNMLVATTSGGTFTLEEFREDLQASGFRDVELLVKDPGMHSVVAANLNNVASPVSRRNNEPCSP
jgi:ubiquinone/menaquinone biosynthesis C-methylase UbiE